MLNVDRRILVISFARAIESFGISFFIVILPLFIASERIVIDHLLGASLLGIVGTEELLIGVALSAAALFSSLGQPLGGRLSDEQGGRKLFIIAGLLLLIVTFPFYLIVSSYFGVLLLRVLQGVSGILIIPASVALINDYVSSNSVRGESFGVYNTLRLIGFGVGPIAAGGIVTFGPYDFVFVIVSGIDAAFLISILTAIISLLLIIVFVSEPEATVNEGKGRSQSFRELVTSEDFRPVLVLALGTFLMAASIAVFATLENVVNERLDQTPFLFSIQFSIAVLANTLVQTPIGRGTDVHGRRPYILLGFVLLIPSITAQGFVVSPVQMLVARLVQGVAVAMVFAPALALAGDLAGDGESGTYLSVLTGAFGFGIAVGPVLSGILFSFGGFAMPFVVSGVLSCVGLLLAYVYIPDL